LSLEVPKHEVELVEALLFAPEKWLVDEVLGRLDASHFSHPHLRSLYEAFVGRVQGEEYPDWRNVADVLPVGSPLARRLAEDAAAPRERLRMSRGRLARVLEEMTAARTRRRVVELLDDVKKRALSGGTEDVLGVLLDGVYSIVHEGEAVDGAHPVKSYTDDFVVELEERVARRGIAGLKTGLGAFDRYLGGLQKGNLVVLAGRPGSYKSTVAAQVAINVARQGHRVLLSSPEMSAAQLISRWAFAAARVPYERFLDGTLSGEEQRAVCAAVERLKQLDIVINQSGLQSTADIRRDIIRWKPDLLIVDYLGLIYPAKDLFRHDEYRDVTETSREINAMKKEFRLPILLLSQLNRAVESREDKKPQLSDLRSSGQVEQDADAVVLLYHPGRYAEERDGSYYLAGKEVDPNELLFIVGKNRSGPTGAAKGKVAPGALWINDGREEERLIA